ncbi:hypothetical protein F2P81_017415 [Scophthalmus maximus]|uniref:Uncharacterized protein n=1 Tax=Scophthalmus maximus TaxID=52904 RepID=A0A6A4SI91_SCOMX|nr:hypothetical protein F2P81_017415 [Scophthalmus maximus]
MKNAKIMHKIQTVVGIKQTKKQTLPVDCREFQGAASEQKKLSSPIHSTLCEWNCKCISVVFVIVSIIVQTDSGTFAEALREKKGEPPPPPPPLLQPLLVVSSAGLSPLAATIKSGRVTEKQDIRVQSSK